MTGRGRPRKAATPKTDCAKGKTTTAEYPENGFTEEKHNATTTEQKPKGRNQKTPNSTNEKSSEQSSQKKKTKNFTEEINKPPTDDTKAPSRGSRATTGAGKSKEKSEVELTKPQPETPKDKTQDSATATKPKKRPGTAKSEEKTKTTQPEDTTKTSIKSTKPKTWAGKDKSKEKSEVELTKPQPETPKDKTQDSATATKPKKRPGTAKSEEKTKTTQPEDTTKTSIKSTKTCATVDSLLSTTLETLKIKKRDKSDTSEVVNNLIKHIIKHLKKNTCCFTTAEPLKTGSYYENLKISKPDEFDVMLSIEVDRVKIEPFGDNRAFYSVALKRGNNPLKKFQDDDILCASEMLTEFRDEVKKCVKAFPDWTVTRKKPGCPAVTLTTTVQSVIISLDVVLSIKVRTSWPAFTQQGFQIQGWLGTKVKQDYKRQQYYLVPKYEGRGAVEHDGVLAKDAWRVSFSHVEKGILLNHGSEKTCCEREGQRCCRKECLKLLKHLLSLLKEREASFEKFYSYQAKTTLLHACSSRGKDSDWSASSLSRCFLQLLEDFMGHLERCVLPNFFIPDQNLLFGIDKTKCLRLARCIKEECDNGFPIFRLN
ncbi:cyclic GMP-AMP synthase isoform X1 [Hippoglossus stenolepis]|uniref:cyclic GMP-AMP synthase isoform X1 n=1 Tax=Hippoglossus stenolepis TaxID=195615 RepID=UPI00159C9C68|nr:cyclic GMP-AMP synthase isoform X1 [Hippoglossus stenolepis]